MYTGIALVPQTDTLQKLVELQRRLLETTPLAPVLGTEKNLPHITLLQGESTTPLCSRSELEWLAWQLPVKSEEPSVRTFHVEYVERGWYFLKVYWTPWLQTLHETTFTMCRDRLLVNSNPSKDLTGYNEEQKKNYLQYGYRYIGSQFAPHITLGRTLDYKRSSHEPLFFELVNSVMTDADICVDRLSLYVMGENGSHAIELTSVPLQR